MKRILFVCHGNICRSSMAEFILKRLVLKEGVADLYRIVGEDREGKVSLMMSWCGNGRDMADPWYTGDFERTYQDIPAGCEAMIELDLHHQ